MFILVFHVKQQYKILIFSFKQCFKYKFVKNYV